MKFITSFHINKCCLNIEILLIGFLKSRLHTRSNNVKQNSHFSKLIANFYVKQSFQYKG